MHQIQHIYKDRLNINQIKTWKGHSFVGSDNDAKYFLKVFPKIGHSKGFVQRQVDISNHLISKGIATPRHIPVNLESGEMVGEADEFYYFVQEFVENQEKIDFTKFGVEMRKVDEALADFTGILEPYLPLSQYEREIRDLKSHSPREVIGQIKNLYISCLKQSHNLDISSTPIHGDMHTKNVIINSGRYYIIDFEQVGLNIPEFSTLNMEGENRLFKTISDEEYLEFCKGIGYNIRNHKNYFLYKMIYDLSVMIAYAQKGDDIKWVTQ